MLNRKKLKIVLMLRGAPNPDKIADAVAKVFGVANEIFRTEDEIFQDLNLSRSHGKDLFSGKKVFLDGQPITDVFVESTYTTQITPELTENLWES
jgi:hypothetical protein